jgi:SAM-dependent methyltransferase
VITTNTIYLWPDLEADVREIARVTRPGGRLVIVFRAGRSSDGEWCVAESGCTSRPSSMSIAELEAAVSRSGFATTRRVLRHFAPSLLVGSATAGAVVALRS